MTEPSQVHRDLEEAWPLTEPLWADLRGARILITGGTGFMGSWLLESLCHADRKLGLGLRAVVLTRSPQAFREKAPHLAGSPLVDLVQGDILSLPDLSGEFTHLIHAATEASAHLLRTDPLRMHDTIVAGTRNILGWASGKSLARALFLSSGAVYGPQPEGLDHIPDDWQGAPDCTSPLSAYAEGKRAAENLCAIFARQHALPVSIARCFAFVGPYLPLDTHFAIGNFIRDALQGGPILVKGDGLTVRSYLYASDMTAWLWHLLLRGEPGQPVNVGSEQAISIGELVALVGRLFQVDHRILGESRPGSPIDRYVPATHRAKAMGLCPRVSLEDGIRRTAQWHAARMG